MTIQFGEPIRTWGDVAAMALVLPAAIWARLQYYRPSVRAAWAAQERAELEAVTAQVAAQWREDAGTDLVSWETNDDGMGQVTQLSDGYDERQEVAIRSCLRRWEQELAEAVGEPVVSFEVEFTTARTEA